MQVCRKELTDITVALDKYEKVGWESVKAELTEKGISDNVISEFGAIVRVIDKDNSQKIEFLSSILIDSQIGTQGLQELKKLLDLLQKAEIKSEVIFDLTLARGLNYYTGAIIEVKSADVSIGSICGGGRYDNLTGVFGMEGVSGVGISFGADRIYDVLNSLDLFEETACFINRQSLLLNFGDAETDYALKILADLRSMDVNAELYPDQVKLKKQMSYADAKKIPFIIIAGEDEIKSDSMNIKKYVNRTSRVNLPLTGLESFVNEIY